MAGAGAVLSRIRARAAAYDDDALAALANRGLVRRAHKDLERLRPLATEVDEHAVLVHVEDFLVTIPESIHDARCSCPATSVCRHVLAALIELRDAGSLEDAVVSDCLREILAVDDAQLLGWAGRTVFDRALRFLSEDPTVSVEEGPTTVFSFPGTSITCRWIPAAGLEGMLCSCHVPQSCEHRVAAVLAYRISRGAREPGSSETARSASREAPRTRDEVLESVRALACGTIVAGLSRVSDATGQRLRTLAASAHGVDLPRLEGMLRAVADEVVLEVRRDAHASGRNLLGGLATLNALRSALEHPTPALVGEHRTRYRDIGSVVVTGLGARQWRSRSGYAGITVFFRDLSSGGWATWTDARPVTTEHVDPSLRYRGDGPWAGCASPAEASRSVLRLFDAARNAAGRLSGRDLTTAVRLSDSDAGQVPGLVTDWREISRAAGLAFGRGLSARREQQDIVMLKPDRWGPAVFDRARQELIRPILDTDGRAVRLKLSFTALTEGGVSHLEAYTPGAEATVLGLLRMDGLGLFVEPVALHDLGQVVNLTLDCEPSDPAASPPEPSDSYPDRDEPERVNVETAPSPLGDLLGTLEAVLEGMAEEGINAARDVSHLRDSAQRAESVGLFACARGIRNLVDSVERSRSEPERGSEAAAGALLYAYYVSRLASTHVALVEAERRVIVPMRIEL